MPGALAALGLALLLAPALIDAAGGAGPAQSRKLPQAQQRVKRAAAWCNQQIPGCSVCYEEKAPLAPGAQFPGAGGAAAAGGEAVVRCTRCKAPHYVFNSDMENCDCAAGHGTAFANGTLIAVETFEPPRLPTGTSDATPFGTANGKDPARAAGAADKQEKGAASAAGVGTASASFAEAAPAPRARSARAGPQDPVPAQRLAQPARRRRFETFMRAQGYDVRSSRAAILISEPLAERPAASFASTDGAGAPPAAAAASLTARGQALVCGACKGATVSVGGIIGGSFCMPCELGTSPNAAKGVCSTTETPNRARQAARCPAAGESRRGPGAALQPPAPQQLRQQCVLHVQRGGGGEVGAHAAQRERREQRHPPHHRDSSSARRWTTCSGDAIMSGQASPLGLLLLLLAAAAGAAAAADAGAGVTWFIQVTDLHISRFFHPEIAPDLSAFAHAVAGPAAPAALLLTGDLVDAKTRLEGSQQHEVEWKAYEAAWRELAQAAGLPPSLVIDLRGNHGSFDTLRGTAQDLFVKHSATAAAHGAAAAASRRVWATALPAQLVVPAAAAAPGSAGRRLRRGGPAAPACPAVVLLGIDVSPNLGLHGPTNFLGVAGADLIERLAAQLAALRGGRGRGERGAPAAGALPPGCASATPVVSYSHHTLSSVAASYGARAGAAEGGRAVREVLAAHDVSAHLSGHLHAPGPRLFNMHAKRGARGGAPAAFLADLEAADWKAARRWRLLAADGGVLSFADLTFRRAPCAAADGGECFDPADDARRSPAAAALAGAGGGDAPRAPRGGARYSYTVASLDPSRVVGQHVVLLTSPADGAFSPLTAAAAAAASAVADAGDGGAVMPVRALVVPLRLRGDASAGAGELASVTLRWGCDGADVGRASGQAPMAPVGAPPGGGAAGGGSAPPFALERPQVFGALARLAPDELARCGGGVLHLKVTVIDGAGGASTSELRRVRLARPAGGGHLPLPSSAPERWLIWFDGVAFARQLFFSSWLAQAVGLLLLPRLLAHRLLGASAGGIRSAPSGVRLLRTQQSAAAELAEVNAAATRAATLRSALSPLALAAAAGRALRGFLLAPAVAMATLAAHHPAVWAGLLAHSAWTAVGPWFCAQFSSASGVGLWFHSGLLLPLPAGLSRDWLFGAPGALADAGAALGGGLAWVWLPTPDPLLLSSLMACMILAPLTLWLGLVTAHWHAEAAGLRAGSAGLGASPLPPVAKGVPGRPACRASDTGDDGGSAFAAGAVQDAAVARTRSTVAASLEVQLLRRHDSLELSAAVGTGGLSRTASSGRPNSLDEAGGGAAEAAALLATAARPRPPRGAVLGLAARGAAARSRGARALLGLPLHLLAAAAALSFIWVKACCRLGGAYGAPALLLSPVVGWVPLLAALALRRVRADLAAAAALHRRDRCLGAGVGSSRAARRAPVHPRGVAGLSRAPARTATRTRYQTDAAPAPAPADEAMFCYQCEQTKGNTGCTKIGVCGKTAQVAILQDLLIYQLKGLGAWATFAHQAGVATPELDSFVKAAIFSTLTNVNFDPERFVDYITTADDHARGVRAQLAAAGVRGRPVAAPLPWFDLQGSPLDFDLRAAMRGQPINAETLEALGEQVSLLHRRDAMGPDAATLLGLHELLTYGLKGVAAYAHHAEMLGEVDASLDDTFEEVLAFLASEAAADADAVLGMCMRLGETNFAVMAMLDRGHTGRYGHPTPTQVRITPVVGKAILISGHDMHDLEDLLAQTEGTGVNVYTHGEMLPGHGYPALQRPHLVGNYGGAWYRQKRDFAEFPGAILMTTNCIMDPSPSYADRLFTTGEVGVSASAHLAKKDFSAVIAKALEMPGFTHEPEPKFVTVGFGHKATLGAAGAVLDAVASGELSHIFLVGGCDAGEPSRRYYTDVVAGLPKDTMVLTLGCGKYRFYDQDLGTLPSGLPRMLDMGQCNDAFSALVVATELAKALNTDVNSLPLSLDISWFEQKAVAVLLTLLHLGIKNIRLGPQLPAFATPAMIDLLVSKFNLKAADTKHAASEEGQRGSRRLLPREPPQAQPAATAASRAPRRAMQLHRARPARPAAGRPVPGWRRHNAGRRCTARAAAGAATAAAAAAAAADAEVHELLTRRSFAPERYVGPVDVLEVPGKRYGLVATENLAVGALLLVVAPLAVAFGRAGSAPSNEQLVAEAGQQMPPSAAAWLRLLHRQQRPLGVGGEGQLGEAEQGGQQQAEQRQEEAGAPRPSEELALLRRLLRGGDAAGASGGAAEGGGGPSVAPSVACPLDGAALAAAVAENAFAVASEDAGAALLRELQPEAVAGLWPEYALLNHDCAPNTVAVVVGRFLLLRAAAPVLAGEELTASYLGRRAWAPVAARRAWLAGVHGFHCTCGRCLAEQASFPTVYYPADNALLGVVDPDRPAGGGGGGGGAAGSRGPLRLLRALLGALGAPRAPRPSRRQHALLAGAAAAAEELAAAVQEAAAADSRRLERQLSLLAELTQRVDEVLAAAADAAPGVAGADWSGAPASPALAARWLAAAAQPLMALQVELLELLLSSGELPVDEAALLDEAAGGGGGGSGGARFMAAAGAAAAARLALRRRSGSGGGGDRGAQSRGGGWLSAALGGLGGGGDDAGPLTKRQLLALYVQALGQQLEVVDAVARGSEVHVVLALKHSDALRTLAGPDSDDARLAEGLAGRAHAARYGVMRGARGAALAASLVAARRRALVGASLARKMGVLAWEGATARE
ncbi:hcp [Scenedesmus sp. PABB004]|nr:hcp [Scenedesmus sp. PABB004]